MESNFSLTLYNFETEKKFMFMKSSVYKWSLFFLILFGAAGIKAQDFKIGIKFQKTHSLYWENGVSAQYSFVKIRPGQLYVGLDILSSRLGSALGSNALKQNTYLGSLSYYFRKNKAFKIITKVNAGFFKVDLGNELFNELPDTALLLSPELGLVYDFKHKLLSLNLGAGLNVNTKTEGESPGTLQPLFYNLTMFYKFNNI